VGNILLYQIGTDENCLVVQTATENKLLCECIKVVGLVMILTVVQLIPLL
jgi:hypothetical protein